MQGFILCTAGKEKSNIFECYTNFLPLFAHNSNATTRVSVGNNLQQAGHQNDRSSQASSLLV